ncbi:unnamed protein product [Diamesa tonsa]
MHQQLDFKYDVNIRSLPKSDNSSNCYEVHHCYKPDIPANQSFVTFPSTTLYITDREPCVFQHECSYNISVKSLNGKFRQSVIYKIEECVGSFCSCKHGILHRKPRIKINIKNLEQLVLEWDIEPIHNNTDLPSDIFLQYIAINFDERKDCNSSYGGGIKSILTSFQVLLDHFGESKLTGHHTQVFNSSMAGKCIAIRAHVVDTHGCEGPEFNQTISIPRPKIDQQLAIDLNQRTPITPELILIVSFCLVFIFGFIMLIIYGYFWHSRKKSNNWRGVYHNVQHNSGQMIPMKENILYFEKDSDTEWLELPHSAIREIGREIGKGAFGRVFIARVDNINGKGNQIVAIKRLKKCPTTDQLEEFLGEISTMKRVGKHPNVVRLLGFCTQQRPLIMVMEFVGCGDLLQYLRKVRTKHEATLPKSNYKIGMGQFNNNSNSSCCNSTMKNSPSNHSQILGPLGKYLDILHSHSTSSASESSSYITQPDSIPSSMMQQHSRPSFAETSYTNLTVNPELSAMTNTSHLEYIVDHVELHNFAIQIARGMKHLEEKQITHRDLAARNILIDENKTLKISDFGLSRTGIYVNTKNKKVPLRWLSIEAMKDNLYSSKSDVWAFAIVLWEIGTLGGFPYPTVSNHELLTFLKTGQRLEQPENCSTYLYELMAHCWEADPDDRPSFSDINKKLDPNRSKIYIDFSELSPNYVFPPTSDDFKNNAGKTITKH